MIDKDTQPDLDFAWQLIANIKKEGDRMAKYNGNDNDGNPKANYLAKLKLMSDKDLYQETKDKIWLSAYANNNPRSDFHWQCDACYDEWVNRDKIEMYDKAHKEVSS